MPAPEDPLGVIAGLDPTRPLDTEKGLWGDDTFRMIKLMLQSQFPGEAGNGFAATITAWESEINTLRGLDTGSTMQEHIDSKEGVLGNPATNGEALTSLADGTRSWAPAYPPGGITAYAGAAAPNGWLLCDGSLVSRTTYSALFTAIGTLYGAGDGSTTFALPDLVGRVPVGVGTGDAADATAKTIAEKDGAETHLLTADESGLPAHTHAISGFPKAYSRDLHDSDNPAYQGTVAKDTDENVAEVAAEAHNNMQPYLAINYIVKT